MQIWPSITWKAVAGDHLDEPEHLVNMHERGIGISHMYLNSRTDPNTKKELHTVLLYYHKLLLTIHFSFPSYPDNQNTNTEKGKKKINSQWY